MTSKTLSGLMAKTFKGTAKFLASHCMGVGEVTVEGKDKRERECK